MPCHCKQLPGANPFRRRNLFFIYMFSSFPGDVTALYCQAVHYKPDTHTQTHTHTHTHTPFSDSFPLKLKHSPFSTHLNTSTHMQTHTHTHTHTHSATPDF